MAAQLRPKPTSSPKFINRFNGEGRSHYLHTAHPAAPPQSSRGQQDSATSKPVNAANTAHNNMSGATPLAAGTPQTGVKPKEPAAQPAAAAPNVTTAQEHSAAKRSSFGKAGKNIFKGVMSQKWRREQ